MACVLFEPDICVEHITFVTHFCYSFLCTLLSLSHFPTFPTAQHRSQQKLDDVIEHLYEYYTTMRLEEAPATFEESSVRSLAQQLGAWPQTAVRKFQKLEQQLKNYRQAMLRQATLDEQQQQQQEQQEQQQQQQQQVLSRLSGGSGWGDDLNASSGASSSGVSFDGSMSAMNMEGGGSSSSVMGETQWSQEVVVSLPPMSKRRIHSTGKEKNGGGHGDGGRVSVDGSRMSLLSVDGDALDL
jgi:hypothetical protein